MRDAGSLGQLPARSLVVSEKPGLLRGELSYSPAIRQCLYAGGRMLQPQMRLRKGFRDDLSVRSEAGFRRVSDPFLDDVWPSAASFYATSLAVCRQFAR